MGPIEKREPVLIVKSVPIRERNELGGDRRARLLKFVTPLMRGTGVVVRCRLARSLDTSRWDHRQNTRLGIL